MNSMSQTSKAQRRTTSERKTKVFETGVLSLRIDLPYESHPAWRAVQSTRVRRSFTPRAAESVAELFETFPSLLSETTDEDRDRR